MLSLSHFKGISCAAILLGPGCHAASPAFSSLTPTGGQRGTEVDFTLTGQRLADVKGLLFYTPGFEVTKLEAPDEHTVKARVKIAGDCALGEHALRVWTATGISELRTLRIGSLACIDEVEPNNDAAHAQKIPLNVTVSGVVKNEDVDWFSIDAKKGERITAEVEGMRLGWTMFDPWLAIRKADGTPLAESDDSSLGLQDPLAAVIAPEDGTYFIELRTADFSGTDLCRYRLHVGTFPQPLVAYPPGGEAGGELRVTFLGDARGPIEQGIKLPAAETSRTQNFFAEQENLAAPVANKIRVSPFPNVLESEPNNDAAHATLAGHPLPIALNGVISEKNDVDFFKFKAKKDEAWDVRVFARALRSPLDSVLAIFDGNGKQLASNDDSGGPDSYLRFKVPTDGEYCVSIRDQLHRGGADFVYRVELTPVTPNVTLAFPEFVKDSQERQSVVVPRGNRCGTLIHAKREDTDGDLSLKASEMPAGVTMPDETMAGGVDTVPLVFEAAAGATLDAKICNLTARPVEANKKAESHFDQTVDLVIGPPDNTPFCQTHVHEIAVSVADEAPFTLRVDEPEVPVVQNGAMDLHVFAERKQGFNGEINVSLLWKPPGIGAESTVKIPAGSSEASITLNANPDAPVRKWRTAVIGSADSGKGTVLVSTRLFEIEAALPFVTATIARSSVEQGEAGTVICRLKQLTPFDGKAKIELLGLPNKVTAPIMEISAADADVRFQIATDKASPAGLHKSLFCKLTVTKNGHPVIQNIGLGGMLRIDRAATAATEQK